MFKNLIFLLEVKKDGPNKGRTPLMEAARQGHDKLAELLDKEDVDPDIQDFHSRHFS